jgi:hypothetical protein
VYRSLLTVFVITFLMLLTPAAPGQKVYESAKILASDGAPNSLFGIAVSLSGDLALVGASYDDEIGKNSGSAYIFRFDPGTGTWIEEAKLLASDGAAGDRFGCSVSLSGEIAVVGAYCNDANGSDSGSAYIFRFHSGSVTWNEEAKLIASDGAPYDYFGGCVSLSGEAAVVSANRDDDEGTDSGSAYVFRYDSGTTTWIEKAKLLASDGAAGDYFGCSVSLAGELAVIGAYYDDDSGTDSGSAYVFRFDSGTGTWIEEAKLLASDGAAFDSFGDSVSLSGERAMIGAGYDDGIGQNSGSAYIFRFDPGTGSWNEEAKLVASDSAIRDYFGLYVSLSGERAVVGALYDDNNGPDSGSAYIFRFDPGTGIWIEEAKLLASDGTAYDKFGGPVALSGELAVVGVAMDQDLGPESGSAYLFDLSSGTRIFSLYFNPVPIHAGQPVRFAATNGRGNTTTYLAYSLAGPGSTPVPALNVTLGLANPIPAGVQVSAADGNVHRKPFLFHLANPGQTIWFQAVQFGQVTDVMSTTVQ